MEDRSAACQVVVLLALGTDEVFVHLYIFKFNYYRYELIKRLKYQITDQLKWT